MKLEMRNCILLLLVLAGFSPDSPAQTSVPVEKEPMHRLKFENEFVRVFDVLIPPGKETLMHTHLFDGVGVRISYAEMSEQFADGTVKNFIAKWGEAGFGSGLPFPIKWSIPEKAISGTSTSS